MATQLHTAERAEAQTSNVISLPTAAPKKVRQCPSRTKAADWRALAQFPMRDIVLRQIYTEADKQDARLIRNTDTAGVMQMVVAMFGAMDPLRKAMVLAQLETRATTDQAGTQCALAWTRYELASDERRRHLVSTLKYIEANELGYL